MSVVYRLLLLLLLVFLSTLVSPLRDRETALPAPHLSFSLSF